MSVKPNEDVLQSVPRPFHSEVREASFLLSPFKSNSVKLVTDRHKWGSRHGNQSELEQTGDAVGGGFLHSFLSSLMLPSVSTRKSGH